MDIAIVTDEISADPETAFELGLEMGIEHFELRGVHNGRIPRIDSHTRVRLLRAVRDFGITVSAVSPGLFKMPLPSAEPARSNLGWMDAGFFRQWQDARAAMRDHLDNLLPETIDFAGETGAHFIIAFSFHRGGAPGGPAPTVATDYIQAAAERVRAAGLELLIETEESFWADTGERTAAMVETIGAGRVGVNWDPANSFFEEDAPFPTGYGHLRPYVRNVHFKDARRGADGHVSVVADGEIDWRGQIHALVRDGYAGCIAIEPHLERPVAAVRNSLKRLRSLIAEASAT